VLKLKDLLMPVAHGAYGAVSAPSKGHVLEKAARDAAVEQRVAAGGSAHKSAPDVRRTPNLSDEKRIAAQRLACELIERLEPLIDLGLGYISLDRSTPTLSSGELQRLRLATQLSSQLFGVVYVLDEPSAGLHPADGEALLTILERLKAAGNSLFVEHDLDVIRRAEWLVDVGPGAGEKGGEVLYSGPIEGLANVETSITRRYLFAEPLRSERTPRDPKAWLGLEGIRRNNLHGLDVEFPIGCFTAVTGVSGSGKSSLVSQALPELVTEHLGGSPSCRHRPEEPYRPPRALLAGEQHLFGLSDIVGDEVPPALLAGESHGDVPKARERPGIVAGRGLEQRLVGLGEALPNPQVRLVEDALLDHQHLGLLRLDPEHDQPVDDAWRQGIEAVGGGEPEDVVSADREIDELVDEARGILALEQ